MILRLPILQYKLGTLTYNTNAGGLGGKTTICITNTSASLIN
jgi:hypothetical protein